MTTTIVTIDRPKPYIYNGRQMPGYVLINDSILISGRDWRNIMTGNDMPPIIPLHIFIGCTISYEVLIITEEMLSEAGGYYPYVIEGREILFTKAGIKFINVQIDWTTFDMSKITEEFVEQFKELMKAYNDMKGGT